MSSLLRSISCLATACALLWSALALGFTTQFADPNLIHQDIVSRAIQGNEYSFPGQPIGTKAAFKSKAITALRDEQASIDNPLTTFYEATDHFDSELLQGSFTSLSNRRSELLQLLAQPSPDEDDVWELLGGILHTAQDFYAHSTWVAKGHVPMGAPDTWPIMDFGVKTKNGNVNPPDEFKAQADIGNVCEANNAAKLINAASGDIITGYYLGTGSDYDEVPANHCNHGDTILGYNRCKGLSSAPFDGISHDNPCIFESLAEKKIAVQAQLLAQRETTIFVDSIIQDLVARRNARGFCVMLGIEPLSQSRCVNSVYPVTVTVDGLTGAGLKLLNNGGDELRIPRNGTFPFPTPLSEGRPFSVTVGSQPAGQFCEVTPSGSGSGSVARSPYANVVISCTQNSSTVSLSIGGTVTGLTASGLVLRNGTNNLNILNNGSFVFTTKLPIGALYSVTVATQPPGQVCTVTNGAGTVATTNITNVIVTCVAAYSIGGTVTGLTGTGLVLKNNGGNSRSVAANGTFAFTTQLTSGSSYVVTVSTQPGGQTCTVTNGSGTVASANITNVIVTCTTVSTPTYSIGGTVTGLTGSGLVLRNNGGDSRSVAASGTFTFATQLTSGSGYSITVSTQPAGQVCTVTNGAGAVASANITNVAVSCAAVGANTYTIGGTVTGLTGTGLVLQINGGNSRSVAASGTFAFSTLLPGGASYAVTVSTQPAGQACTVTNGVGTVASTNITNVIVACGQIPAVSAKTIAAGDGHNLILRTDGNLMSTGLNVYGQLGTFNQAGFIFESSLSGVSSLGAGQFNSFAIKSNGTLWVAGANPTGQLGTGSVTFSGVSPFTQVLTNVVSARGSDATSLVLKGDGTLLAAGLNGSGALGTNDDNDRLSFVPVLTNVSTMAAGIGYSLAVRTDGTLWATGSYIGGPPGGTLSWERITDVQVATGVRSVSAGIDFSLVLKTDGSLWAIGDPGGAGTGLISYEQSQQWRHVMDDVSAIDSSALHSLVLKVNGALLVSGSNMFGELGTGNTTDRNTFTQVLSGVAAISAGNLHSLALRTNGTVWAAGENSSFGLGILYDLGNQTIFMQIFSGALVPP